MARDKSEKSAPEAKPERSEAIKPMPFPGESPTVALALAAGQMYGLHEEDEKPTKSQPKKRATAKKKAAAPRKKTAKAAPKRKTAAKRPSKGGAGKATAASKRPAKGSRSR